MNQSDRPTPFMTDLNLPPGNANPSNDDCRKIAIALARLLASHGHYNFYAIGMTLAKTSIAAILPLPERK